MDYKLNVTLSDDFGDQQVMNACYSSSNIPEIEFELISHYFVSLLSGKNL